MDLSLVFSFAMVADAAMNVGRLGPGDSYAEISLLSGTNSSGTFTALTSGLLLGLPAADLKPIFEARPELVESLSHSAAKLQQFVTTFDRAAIQPVAIEQRELLWRIRPNPLLDRLAALPIRVPFHSIMGDRGRGGGVRSSDGVVPYSSSHLAGVESEKIVPTGHGVFSNEAAVFEIKRILVHYIRDSYSNSMIILWHDDWSDHTGAARAA